MKLEKLDIPNKKSDFFLANEIILKTCDEGSESMTDVLTLFLTHFRFQLSRHNYNYPANNKNNIADGVSSN